MPAKTVCVGIAVIMVTALGIALVAQNSQTVTLILKALGFNSMITVKLFSDPVPIPPKEEIRVP